MTRLPADTVNCTSPTPFAPMVALSCSLATVPCQLTSVALFRVVAPGGAVGVGYDRCTRAVAGIPSNGTWGRPPASVTAGLGNIVTVPMACPEVDARISSGATAVV